MDAAHKPNGGFLAETPLDAVQARIEESILIDGRTFILARPADSELLLDHPAIHSAFAADEYMPYWTDLWPGARMLARAILRESWPPGLEALEIGCGLGLPGLAALAVGMHVTFSDYDATALRFAANNARLNGFDKFRLLQLDWRYPPDDMQMPLVLASDLIYELRNVEPLVGLIKRVLRPGGLGLLTDQNRVPSHVLREALPAAGLQFTTHLMHAGEPGGRRFKGTLYRIRHAE